MSGCGEEVGRVLSVMFLLVALLFGFAANGRRELVPRVVALLSPEPAAAPKPDLGVSWAGEWYTLERLDPATIAPRRGPCWRRFPKALHSGARTTNPTIRSLRGSVSRISRIWAGFWKPSGAAKPRPDGLFPRIYPVNDRVEIWADLGVSIVDDRPS